MPYRWTETPEGKTLTLWPHRSMPIRVFAALFLAAFLFAIIPIFGLIGTALVWGLLPFILISLAGLYWAIMHTYRTGDAREDLTITAEETCVIHTPHKGMPQTWQCKTYWTRAQIYPSQGPVPYYITLKGNGREAELGRLLSEDERKVLFAELQSALDTYR